MTPKLEYKAVASDGPEGFVYTDSQGSEYTEPSNIVDQVNAAISAFDKSVVMDLLTQQNQYLAKAQAVTVDIGATLGQ